MAFARLALWVIRWEMWLAILFTIGCAFWIINQLHTWKDKHKKGLSNYSDKEIENIIREWVDTPFLSFKREDVPNVYFQFVVIKLSDLFIPNRDEQLRRF
jgi:hypothetical protein